MTKVADVTDRTNSPAELTSEASAFLERPLFATLATINPDGSPNQAVIWYALRDGAFLINSREDRVWPRNLRRDPRASLAVEDGYNWVGVRGSVEVVDEQQRAQADIAALARRYHADEPDVAERKIANFRKQQRVTFVLRPEKIYLHLDD